MKRRCLRGPEERCPDTESSHEEAHHRPLYVYTVFTIVIEQVYTKFHFSNTIFPSIGRFWWLSIGLLMVFNALLFGDQVFSGGFLSVPQGFLRSRSRVVGWSLESSVHFDVFS